MTVGDLKKLLEDVPDEVPIFNLCSGHEIDFFEFENEIGYVNLK